MPSNLLLVVDAHIKCEVSSFSCSRDIRIRILKRWVSSAVLVVFHYSTAETERCNRFSNCRPSGAPTLQMYLKSWGTCGIWEPRHRCCKLLFRLFCPIFKPRVFRMWLRSKNGAKFCTFCTFWPLVKNRGGLMEMSIQIIRATHRF